MDLTEFLRLARQAAATIAGSGEVFAAVALEADGFVITVNAGGIEFEARGATAREAAGMMADAVRKHAALSLDHAQAQRRAADSLCAAAGVEPDRSATN